MTYHRSRCPVGTSFDAIAKASGAECQVSNRWPGLACRPLDLIALSPAGAAARGLFLTRYAGAIPANEFVLRRVLGSRRKVSPAALPVDRPSPSASPEAFVETAFAIRQFKLPVAEGAHLRRKWLLEHQRGRFCYDGPSTVQACDCHADGKHPHS